MQLITHTLCYPHPAVAKAQFSFGQPQNRDILRVPDQLLTGQISLISFSYHPHLKHAAIAINLECPFRNIRLLRTFRYSFFRFRRHWLLRYFRHICRLFPGRRVSFLLLIRPFYRIGKECFRAQLKRQQLHKGSCVLSCVLHFFPERREHRFFRQDTNLSFRFAFYCAFHLVFHLSCRKKHHSQIKQLAIVELTQFLRRTDIPAPQQPMGLCSLRNIPEVEVVFPPL